jgi:hypothetical protein
MIPRRLLAQGCCDEASLKVQTGASKRKMRALERTDHGPGGVTQFTDADVSSH